MWARGTRLRGKLIECSGDDHWIVSIGGKLIGVKNGTPITFQKNQWVDLEVMSDRPLKFQVIGKSQRADRQLRVRI